MKHFESIESNRESMKRFPMNIQLFADGGEAADGGNTNVGTANGDSGTGDNTPSYEDLVTQLAQERAEKEKLKLANDKASREAAGYKKQLQSKMTAEEQEAEAKKAQEEAKDARIQELESKFRTMDYSKRYMGLGMDEQTAEELADLTGEIPDADKFFASLSKFVQTATKKSGEDAIQNLLKDRPEINSGNGGNGTGKSSAEEIASKVATKKRGVQADALKRFM